jgi:tRNA modification GTPase
MAEPGEFTKRAFLGGRIDLARAEAVMDLISSGNEFARKTSAAQLEGAVSARIKELREKILYEIAFIESALDDPENYSLDGYPDRLMETCQGLEKEMRSLLSHA